MMTEKEKEYVCDKLCKYAECAEKFDTDYAWQEYLDEKCKHCMIAGGEEKEESI